MKIKTILVSIWVLIIVPTMTYALFIDTETSVGNTFSATTLQTRMYSDSAPPIIRDLIPDNEVSFPLRLINIGGLETQNSISVPVTNNEEFASLIKTEVRLNEKEIIYQGTLDKLDIPKYLIQQPNQGDELTFIFFISASDYNNTPEEFVKFKIQNHAWQTNMLDGAGFYHNQEIDVAIINPLRKPRDAKPLPAAPFSFERQEGDPKKELIILETNEDEI
jgi:hypothetical protein